MSRAMPSKIWPSGMAVTTRSVRRSTRGSSAASTKDGATTSRAANSRAARRGVMVVSVGSGAVGRRGCGADVLVEELLHGRVQLDLVVVIVEAVAFLVLDDVHLGRTAGFGEVLPEQAVLRHRHAA